MVAIGAHLRRAKSELQSGLHTTESGRIRTKRNELKVANAED